MFHLELVEALRSGKYKQARGALRDRQDCYCVLGVACDLSGVGVWNSDPKWWYYLSDKDYVSDRAAREVCAATGLVNQHGTCVRGYYVAYSGNEYRSLAGLNDAGASFEDLATLIETVPWMFFNLPIPTGLPPHINVPNTELRVVRCG
jgi:hypothetical protein